MNTTNPFPNRVSSRFAFKGLPRRAICNRSARVLHVQVTDEPGEDGAEWRLTVVGCLATFNK